MEQLKKIIQSLLADEMFMEAFCAAVEEDSFSKRIDLLCYVRDKFLYPDLAALYALYAYFKVQSADAVSKKILDYIEIFLQLKADEEK